MFPPCHSPPPPPGSAAPQGGFPTDLMEINLSDWASLVQDVAASLQALPPGLSNLLGPRGNDPAPAAGGGHPGKVLPPLLLPGHKL